jgi:hypothetical protein
VNDYGLSGRGGAHIHTTPQEERHGISPLWPGTGREREKERKKGKETETEMETERKRGGRKEKKRERDAACGPERYALRP